METGNLVKVAVRHLRVVMTVLRFRYRLLTRLRPIKLINRPPYAGLDIQLVSPLLELETIRLALVSEHLQEWNVSPCLGIAVPLPDPPTIGITALPVFLCLASPHITV